MKRPVRLLPPLATVAVPAAALALLTLALTLASACRKAETGPANGTRKALYPTIRFTPMPNPPTPTLRPGQPTPLPDLPG